MGSLWSTHPARRSDDRRLGALTHAIVLWGQRWGAAQAGQVLLLVSGLIAAATFPTFRPDDAGWRALTVVSTTMAILLLVSTLVPWSRLPQRSYIVFPFLVWLAVAALGEAAHGVGANYLGLYVLCFVYVGLTQRPGTGTLLAPIAAVTYVAAYGSWSRLLLPRLLIAFVVWVLVAELLAVLQARHRDLTAQLHRSAHTDVLTGLANRRDLDLRLTTAMVGDLLVICDLDHFKRVNDTYGHTAGDQVLADFGLLLTGSLRTVDYAARLGGEEFAILLPRTEQALAPVILSRLRHRWSVLCPDVTFSCGVATCLPGRSANETLMVADAALYRAKVAGRNRDYSESGPLGTPPAKDEQILH